MNTQYIKTTSGEDQFIAFCTLKALGYEHKITQSGTNPSTIEGCRNAFKQGYNTINVSGKILDRSGSNGEITLSEFIDEFFCEFKIGQYTVEKTATGIKVGCQSVTKDEAKKVAEMCGWTVS